jgi:glycosyltransferase involved in cell wall biosynthesis
MKNNLFVVIPAYNEEKNLEKCVKSLVDATKNLKHIIHTFIILNGCQDNTLKIANKCRSKYPFLNILLLKSKKGKFNAQEEAIKKINSLAPILFIDADVILKKDSIKILLNELNKHPKLLAVGAFPIANKYLGANPWKIFLDEVLNIRSKHPKIEISKLDVQEYHPYAFSDAQTKNTCSIHESKSKIFLHGRMFLLRSKKYWAKPKHKNIVGDDAFISDNLTYFYGKGRIRVRYDALCYYLPFISLSKHYNTYKRIFYDLKKLKERFPQFKEIREHSSLVLDKEYIKKQNIYTKILFHLYSLIRKIEIQLFKYSKKTNPTELWR